MKGKGSCVLHVAKLGQTSARCLMKGQLLEDGDTHHKDTVKTHLDEAGLWEVVHFPKRQVQGKRQAHTKPTYSRHNRPKMERQQARPWAQKTESPEQQNGKRVASTCKSGTLLGQPMRARRTLASTPDFSDMWATRSHTTYQTTNHCFIKCHLWH